MVLELLAVPVQNAHLGRDLATELNSEWIIDLRAKSRTFTEVLEGCRRCG